MLRTVPGLGAADYLPEEEELVRRLLDDDRHQEVALLHELKVAFAATPDQRDECWQTLRDQAKERRRVEQTSLDVTL